MTPGIGLDEGIGGENWTPAFAGVTHSFYEPYSASGTSPRILRPAGAAGIQ